MFASKALAFVALVVAANAASVPTGTQTGTGYYHSSNGVAGACGAVTKDTDLAVSIAGKVFDASLCNKDINASYNGKSVTVKLTDICNGCEATDLDFTPTAYGKLADLSQLKLENVTWSFA
ncbi:plant expansin [Coniophora puteana RWD-64-598 SS2]|uniref:Plant expansin n=1 Tax=Coniophora puteana (strain RWD-64-598) TaxID=741705 RepID=A0A5M3MRR8_CONPW|nr:plant expansin [Coniophora puteana RWD-64-598 SS2]EIW81790.1 plant expansin [Coniophora puteana RWD-64-598 SS2]